MKRLITSGYFFKIRINALHKEDLRREKQEKVLDALLTTIINTRLDLENENFISFTKPEERIKIEQKCNEVIEFFINIILKI